MKLFLRTITGCCALMILLFSSIASALEAVEVQLPVLNVEPAYKSVYEKRPVENCKEVVVSTGGSTSSDTPELLGAIIGGAIGKEIDGKDGSGDEGAIIGALLGASIASDMEKEAAAKKGGTRTEVQCTTVYRDVEVRKPFGYYVTYEYAGHLFRYNVKNRPGSTIAVRVFAVPIDANY